HGTPFEEDYLILLLTEANFIVTQVWVILPYFIVKYLKQEESNATFLAQSRNLRAVD
ncbi:MAG: hypothetical protein RL011_2093, partial [Pseudomonadota bacterium]